MTIYPVTDFIGIWKSTNLLSSTQAGFRQNRSTIDQLARLEHCIQYSLKEKKVVLVTYFDIGKPFDKVPHTTILIKLARLGLEGNSLGWTKMFLRLGHDKYSFLANSLKNTK